MIEPIILLAVLGFGAWFWFDTLQCREIAKALAQQMCLQNNLQLLDDTLALVQIRLKRNSRGRLNMQRTYQFEFSDSGNNRQKGFLIMRGISLEILEMPGYVQRTILPV